MNKLFNLEEQNFIKENVKGISSEKLTNLINQKFNRQITIKQIQQYKKRHNLKSGISTRFFKKQIPHNKKNIGYEFISKDGYTYIKVAEPNVYQHKQIYIYEQTNGKIPKNHSVMFLDKNKSNFNSDDLILVENKDKLVAKNKHLIFKNKELTKIGLMIAKIINVRKQKYERNKSK